MQKSIGTVALVDIRGAPESYPFGIDFIQLSLVTFTHRRL